MQSERSWTLSDQKDPSDAIKVKAKPTVDPTHRTLLTQETEVFRKRQGGHPVIGKSRKPLAP